MDLKLQHFHWLTFKFMMQIELRLINSAYFPPSHWDSLSPLPPLFSSVSNQKSPVTPFTDRHLKFSFIHTIKFDCKWEKFYFFCKKLIWKSFFRTAWGFQLHSAQFILHDELRDFAILHLYISCRIDWFIDFFSPYHHTSTRRISFSKREWHAIKSTFFF